MGRPPRCVWILSALGLAGLVGVTGLLAKSSGADVGYSGGPDGYNFGANNCTSCHAYDTPNNPGPGSVAILDVPRRYRPNAIYDFRVRIADPDQVGAGFEISAENAGGHQGQLLIADALRTRNADNQPPILYVTHTSQGFRDSVDRWAANGNAAEFAVRWQAPATDEGAVTLFAAGNAVNDANATDGDRYYFQYATLPFAHPGDGDGDTDVDLRDVAIFQRCIDEVAPFAVPLCREVDFDSSGGVTLADSALLADALIAAGGPKATLPAGYVLADVVRGGQLYDRWWKVLGTAEPAGNHPLYPPSGQQNGSATFRCKECHGWDYQGADGAYGSGSHFTGIGGIFGTKLSPQALFDLLTADPNETPNGHDMDGYGFADGDIWDVVKMTLEGTIDTDDYIDPLLPDVFITPHNLFLGNFWYDSACASCHDDPNDFDPDLGILRKGTRFNFGTAQDPAYIGTVANDNPWEFLHKMRFGHPGSPMPMLDLLGWPLDQTAAVGKFSVTLPTE